MYLWNLQARSHDVSLSKSAGKKKLLGGDSWLSISLVKDQFIGFSFQKTIKKKNRVSAMQRVNRICRHSLLNTSHGYALAWSQPRVCLRLAEIRNIHFCECKVLIKKEFIKQGSKVEGGKSSILSPAVRAQSFT